jgi:magnesium transporter
MITYYQKTITSRKLKTLNEFKIGSWVYIERPTPEEFRILIDELKLDEGLLKDAIDPFEVPRVEVTDGVTYIFTRIPYEDSTNGEIRTAPVLIGVAEGFVFTISEIKLPFFDRFIDGYVHIHTTQKVRFMLQLLEEGHNAYSRFITLVNREVRRLSGGLSGSIDNEDIVRFVHLETILNDLLDALVPTGTALQKLLSGKFMSLRDEDKEFAEDVYLANGQLIELCRTNLRALMNIRSAYSSIMTNNLNRVIKLLTGFTIILTVPVIVVSAYGMNVPLPFQDGQHAFSLIVLFTAFVTATTLYVFKKKKLI